MIIHMTGTEYPITACGIDLYQRHPMEDVHKRIAPLHIGVTCPQCRETDRFRDIRIQAKEGGDKL